MKNALDEMEYLNDELINEAESFKRKRNWGKWGAVAAVLCVCLIGAFLLFPALMGTGKRVESREDPCAAITALEYSGAYYELTDYAPVLDKFGLPEVLSAEDAGEHLAYFKLEDNAYKETPEETGIELFSYAQSPCRGVLVLKNENMYSAALFVSHTETEPDTPMMTFQQLCQIYGIENAEELASVCEYNGVFEQTVEENLVTDREALKAFYEAGTSMETISANDWERYLFEIASNEDELLAVHGELEEEATTLRLETADGLRFYVLAYPKLGWFEAECSYFRFNDEMAEWFAQNIHETKGGSDAAEEGLEIDQEILNAIAAGELPEPTAN